MRLGTMHDAGLLSDDEFLAGITIQKWARQQMNSAALTSEKLERKFRHRGQWGSSQSLLWVQGWVGPFAWSVIQAFLIEEMGVTEVEKHLDLPARSGKVALKTALSSAAICIHEEPDL